jgi:hypothetical protein
MSEKKEVRLIFLEKMLLMRVKKIIQVGEGKIFWGYWRILK